MSLGGLNVSRETHQKLEHFCSLFQKWSRTINLSAPSTLDQLWQRHVVDSAQIFRLAAEPLRWVDLGSGGGFPGVITAILLSELGTGWVDLVESNKKKAAFLRVALQETGARGAIHAVRAEHAVKLVPHCDAISCRALADLSQLCAYVDPWARNNPQLRCFFHKGRDYEQEIARTHGSWAFDLIKHRSVVEDDSVVLELSNLRNVKRLDERP